MSADHPYDPNKLIALIDAVIDNDVMRVHQLLTPDGDIDPNGTLDEAGITPLHYAAQNNALEVIPLLIEAGADPDVKTHPEGDTPLTIAILHNHQRVIELLLSYNQKVDRRMH